MDRRPGAIGVPHYPAVFVASRESSPTASTVLLPMNSSSPLCGPAGNFGSGENTPRGMCRAGPPVPAVALCTPLTFTVELRAAMKPITPLMLMLLEATDNRTGRTRTPDATSAAGPGESSTCTSIPKCGLRATTACPAGVTAQHARWLGRNPPGCLYTISLLLPISGMRSLPAKPHSSSWCKGNDEYGTLYWRYSANIRVNVSQPAMPSGKAPLSPPTIYPCVLTSS